MTAQCLLTTLQGRGLVLSLDGDRLLCRGKQRGLTPDLRSLMDQHRGELITLLRLDAALVKALSAIEAAKRSHPLTEVQRRVLDLFGATFRDYRAKEDPLLFDAAADIENQVGTIWGLKRVTVGGRVDD